MIEPLPRTLTSAHRATNAQFFWFGFNIAYTPIFWIWCLALLPLDKSVMYGITGFLAPLWLATVMYIMDTLRKYNRHHRKQEQLRSLPRSITMYSRSPHLPSNGTVRGH